jgi:heat shock protein HslJ
MQTEGLHHKWKVSGANDMEVNGNIYIDLRDVHHSGATAGCRYFSFTPKFGHYNRMQIANMAAHLLSCTDDRQDQALQLNLESVYSFSLAGGQLRLLAKDGHVLFSAEKAADDEGSFISRKWLIQQMINADNDQLIKDKSFLDLTDLARARAGVGCNQFSFKVTADHTYHIALENVAATEMYCQHAATNESVFTKVLPLVNKYQVVGNTLKLFDKDNVLLLAATAALQ